MTKAERHFLKVGIIASPRKDWAHVWHFRKVPTGRCYMSFAHNKATWEYKLVKESFAITTA